MSGHLHDTGPEHLVADAGHHGHGVGQGFGQRQAVQGILGGGIFQIELVEDTLFIVLGQSRPVGHAESVALGREASEVGVSRDFIGRHLAATHPGFLAFGERRFGHHPAQQQAQLVERAGYGEDASRLKVVREFHVLQGQAAGFEPMGEGCA